MSNDQSGLPFVSASAYTRSGPPQVSISPDTFENTGNEQDLTVTVQASANTAIEGELVGLDVPEGPGNCPSLKPDPCDIQFAGGQYGGTDENGSMTSRVEWFPGFACSYSGSGDEFTYPKGTFDFSFGVQDTTTAWSPARPLGHQRAVHAGHGAVLLAGSARPAHARGRADPTAAGRSHSVSFP